MSLDCTYERGDAQHPHARQNSDFCRRGIDQHRRVAGSPGTPRGAVDLRPPDAPRRHETSLPPVCPYVLRECRRRAAIAVTASHVRVVASTLIASALLAPSLRAPRARRYPGGENNGQPGKGSLFARCWRGVAGVRRPVRPRKARGAAGRGHRSNGPHPGRGLLAVAVFPPARPHIPPFWPEPPQPYSARYVDHATGPGACSAYGRAPRPWGTQYVAGVSWFGPGMPKMVRRGLINRSLAA